MQDTAPLLANTHNKNEENVIKASDNKRRSMIFWSISLIFILCIFGLHFGGILNKSPSSSSSSSSSLIEPELKLKISTDSDISTYKGAVLEYQVKYHKTYWKDRSGQTVKVTPITSTAQAKFWQNINIKRIEPYVVYASQQEVDILVLPEFALNGLVPTREEMTWYLEKVPNPDECITTTDCIPCDNEEFADRTTLQQLSCLARDNTIYLVVNYGDYVPCTIESDGDCPVDNSQYQYNTQIIFNSHGEIIARYYKIHTYKEDEYNVPKEEDYTTFTMTSPHSGIEIEFGVVICYDTMYGSPFLPLIKNGISNFVMSHWWVNSGPTMNILEWTQAVSQRYGINLLFAASTWFNNGYYPSDSSGSGIYSQGDVITDYYNTNNEVFVGKLLIGDIPLDIITNSDTLQSFPDYLETTDSSIAEQNCNASTIIAQILPYRSDGDTYSATLECGNFKCTAEVTIDKLSMIKKSQSPTDPNWLFMFIFSGYYSVPDGNKIYYYENFCSIAVCDRDCYNLDRNSRTTRTSFVSMKINGNFGDDSTLFVLKGDAEARGADDVDFEIAHNDDETVTVSADDIYQEMLGLSVIGRAFPKDTKLT